MTTLPDPTWFLTDEGRRTLNDARALMEQDASVLRASEALRRTVPAEFAALALTQVELQQLAVTKFAAASELLLTRPGLEQATSEQIASWRAQRFDEAAAIVDLCCGIGGDAMALARRRPDRPVTLVDMDPVHLRLAAHNVRQASSTTPVNTIQDDVRRVNLTPFDGAFIDPARRSGDRRLGYLSEPPLEWATSVAGCVPMGGIKTAPGIPHE